MRLHNWPSAGAGSTRARWRPSVCPAQRGPDRGAGWLSLQPSPSRRHTPRPFPGGLSRLPSCCPSAGAQVGVREPVSLQLGLWPRAPPSHAAEILRKSNRTQRGWLQEVVRGSLSRPHGPWSTRVLREVLGTVPGPSGKEVCIVLKNVRY